MRQTCETCGQIIKPHYRAWQMMKQRCTNPKATGYQNYGGRGIRMCERWFNSYEAFIEDVGVPPHGATLDRIDTDGDYEPGNVRWAYGTTQNRNKRNNRPVTWQGQTKTYSAWAADLGISKQSFAYRMKHWPIEDVFGRAAQDGHRQRYDANLG